MTSLSMESTKNSSSAGNKANKYPQKLCGFMCRKSRLAARARETYMDGQNEESRHARYQLSRPI